MKLVLENVEKFYMVKQKKNPVLKDLHLTIESGTHMYIRGVSGVGKSTLLNIIGLIDDQFEGSYTIDGNDVKKLNEKEKSTLRCEGFGYVFQEYALIENESVYENVKVPLIYSSIKRKKYRKCVEEICEQAGLKEYLKVPVKNLSGGERQRVAVARSLVNRPKVILADEATSNLDQETTKIILDLIHTYAKDKTLIFVTHDIARNFRGFGEIYQMENGILLKS